MYLLHKERSKKSYSFKDSLKIFDHIRSNKYALKFDQIRPTRANFDNAMNS